MPVINSYEKKCRMRSLMTIFLLICLSLFAGCTSPDQQHPSSQQSPVVAGTPSAPYDFETPALIHYLVEDLAEISGLTVLDEHHLGAIQDEDGDLFVIAWQTGEVRAVTAFGKSGDYEGVERVDDRVFVLRSNGTLFEVAGWDGEGMEAEQHKTFLKSRNDTEGLALDDQARRLLIVCKEDPGGGLDGVRAVYAFDLETQELLENPVFTVPLDAFENGKDFKPSALAVHPLTGELYMLSSVQKVVVVLGQDGTLRANWPLPEALFPQPEGLAFYPNGDLFIASEGDGGAPVLAMYPYRSE